MSWHTALFPQTRTTALGSPGCGEAKPPVEGGKILFCLLLATQVCGGDGVTC